MARLTAWPLVSDPDWLLVGFDLVCRGSRWSFLGPYQCLEKREGSSRRLDSDTLVGVCLDGMDHLPHGGPVTGAPGLVACVGDGRDPDCPDFPFCGVFTALQGCTRTGIFLERWRILLFVRGGWVFFLGHFHRGHRTSSEKIIGHLAWPIDAGGTIPCSLRLLDQGVGSPTFHRV